MIWDYDVMMHGTWDANAMNSISDTSVDVIGRYIDAGGGILTGHDSVGQMFGKKYGIGRLADKFNLYIGYWTNHAIETVDNRDSGWAYGSTKVKIGKKGFLTQLPWNLGPVRNSIRYTRHTYCIKCS